MKTIGLIGGMSWESSAAYYRLINEQVRRELGGLHSAECMLYSVDFAPIEEMQEAGAWAEMGEVLADVAGKLEAAGADFILICTNTMHKVADRVQGAVGVPFLHIADATADAVKAKGIRRVGLLGTNFTMEQDFYRGRLEQKHGLEVLVPPPAEREMVHCVIYDELCLGQIKDSSRAEYVRTMENLMERGAEGIILGCTEIGLLVRDGDVPVPLFDTTRIHAEAAVARALTAS